MSQEPAARAAILDYGGVMAVSPIGRIHDLAAELGASPEVVVGTIFGGHGDGSDNPWHDAEAGRSRLDDEFGSRMQARFEPHGVRFDLQSFVRWVTEAVNEPQIEIVDTVRRARAAGIPAREVSGLAYMGDGQKTFGGHAWNEVVLDGIWHPIDASMGQFEVDAARLSLGSATDGGLNLLRNYGTLSLRLIKAEHKN